MKKKVLASLLCASMVATMFAGCGSKTDSETDGGSQAASGTTDESGSDGEEITLNEDFYQ